MISQWVIRKEHDDFDFDIYRIYSELFCIKLYHGGAFSKFPDIVYENGKLDCVDLLNIENFTVLDLDLIVKELGYVDGSRKYYHYLVPGDDLDFGLRPLETHHDVVGMKKYVCEAQEISIYVEVGENSVGIEHKTHVQTLGREQIKVIDAQFDHVFTNIMNPLSDGNQDKAKEIINDDLEESDDEDYDGEDSESEESDGEVSDYIIDEDNEVDEREVDMKDFSVNVNDLAESKKEEEQVLNNDSFGSTSSDEGIDRTRKRNLRRLKKNKGVGGNEKCTFYVGQQFANSKEVKELVKRHAVETRREISFYRNDKLRFRAKCKGCIPKFEKISDPVKGPKSDQVKGPTGDPVNDPTCDQVKDPVKGPTGDLVNDPSSDPVKNLNDGPGKSQSPSQKDGGRKTIANDSNCHWVLYVSRLKEESTWVVKTYSPEHKCLQTRYVRAFTSDWLSKEILVQIESNPGIPIKSIQEQMQRKYEMGVSKQKAFRAKTKATKHVMGDYIQQYGLLRDYILELQRTNPSTTVKLDVEHDYNPAAESRVFKRIYICLGALKQGFRACKRELIGLDGAFMKGPFPGQLLTAVGVHPNNGIYPLAYAIVEAESLNSWTWFLVNLGDDLDLDTNNFTFISDRQKGLIPALSNVFPFAEHRYCLRHIHQNMKLQWRGKAYKDMLWSIATASTIQEFQSKMDELKRLNVEAYWWLQEIQPTHWARSHFTGRAKSDMLLNNLCEVLNAKLCESRDKPIITALEYVREYLMKRIVNVMKIIDKSDGLLTPVITKKFEVIKKEASKLTVQWNGGSKFQVAGYWGEQCVVDVAEKACSCRKWELTGIPCKHAVAANWNMVLNGQQVDIPETWVHSCYWLDTWKDVYSNKVGPINGRSMWPRSSCPIKLAEPLHHKPIGRPRKMRKKMHLRKKIGW